MSRFDDDYRYDYDSIARDCDELYNQDGDWDFEDEHSNYQEWENYYHNIADELVDE